MQKASTFHDECGYSVLFCDRARADGNIPTAPTGTMAEHGFSAQHLRTVASELPAGMAEIIELNPLLPEGEHEADDACVLIVRNTNKASPNDSLEEVKTLQFDTFGSARGKVHNARSRHLVYLSTDGSHAPNATTGEHTVVDFSSLPALNRARLFATGLLGTEDCNSGCAIKYPNIVKCGIGWHGDGERRQTIIYRLGNSSVTHPLCFQWYLRGLPIGKPWPIVLNHGDMAIASEKAVGTDWKLRNVPTLRHATGFLGQGPIPLPTSNAAKRAAKRGREAIGS